MPSPPRELGQHRLTFIGLTLLNRVTLIEYIAEPALPPFYPFSPAFDLRGPTTPTGRRIRRTTRISRGRSSAQVGRRLISISGLRQKQRPLHVVVGRSAPNQPAHSTSPYRQNTLRRGIPATLLRKRQLPRPTLLNRDIGDIGAALGQRAGMSPERPTIRRYARLVATVENRDMASRSRIVATLFAAIVTLILGGCGDEKATLATFAGAWQAHARTLKITRTGNGEEWMSLGLGHFVVALRFHLSRPSGTSNDATATATITAIRLGERSAFTAAHPPPRVGESRRIRLRDGVITETLTGAKYCSPSVDWPDAGCGA